MQIQYYELIAGGLAKPELRHIEAADVEFPSSLGMENIRADVSDKFTGLVKDDPDLGLIVVLSPTIGEPPGAIVAAEISKARVGQREVQWLHRM